MELPCIFSAVECNARDMEAVRHIVDGAKAMCTSLRSWLHRKDSVVKELRMLLSVF